MIAPRLENESWENKPGKIRRVEFGYWTIGHILHTGLVDPENGKLFKFKHLDDFLNFYQSILKRISNLVYEKQIFYFYKDYIQKSADALSEPFLIPEFRYEGLNQKHKYGLYFTILNCRTSELVCFELSLQSTLMAVTGIRSNTQIEMNKDLARKWTHEMQKRNEYFQQYGNTTITFTDGDLGDMDTCFQAMRYYLEKRTQNSKA